MRYSLIIASFAVAAFAAPVAQFEANAMKREAEAQMSRQPVHPDKPGSHRPPPRTFAAESLDVKNDIKIETTSDKVQDSARSAGSKSGKPPRPPCNNRNCPDYPGGRGRRFAKPISITPGTHANDRPISGFSPKLTTEKSKRQTLNRPGDSGKPPGKPKHQTLESTNEAESAIDINADSPLRDSRPGKPGSPNRPISSPNGSSITARSAEAEAEADPQLVPAPQRPPPGSGRPCRRQCSRDQEQFTSGTRPNTK